jgi:hypothetical protein
MDTIEHLYAPTLECASRDAEIGAPDDEDNPTASGSRTAGTSSSWVMPFLPVQRRKAVYALYAFCREIDHIADGAASPSLKQILFMNWRSEIAHLYGGRPRHSVTLGLNQAIHRYGLRCHDFLAIIDGAEMKAQTDTRAPSFAQLDRYCECTAVAVSRLLVRIFGEETPAGEHVAAELGRALQFTDILRDLTQDAKRHRLFLPRELLQTNGVFATMPSGCWRSRLCLTCAVISPYSPNAITRLPLRQLRLAVARRCARRPVMLGIYRALLDALLVRGWRELDVPVRISFRHELALLLRHGLTGR